VVLIGIALAVVLLIAVLVGLWWAWRHPYVSLGLLVAGMAFHSYLLMVLLALGTPTVLVRAFQGWKELVIAVLTAIALLAIWHERREGGAAKLTAPDWAAVAFALVTIVYFLLPSSILHSGANFTQRLVGFRIAFFIPLMYFLGRRIDPANDRERLMVVWLCIGAGAVVAVLGLIELWFVPTRVWLDWGVNLYTSFLGFTYHGPKGLPENFFVTLPDGTLLRRMVSTYISPLGIAYTGILLFPMGVALIDHYATDRRARWLAGTALTLVTVGVLLSVTRLALLAILGEAALLAFLLRRRWLIAIVPILIAGAIVIFFPYASMGPAVDRNLAEVQRSGSQWVITGNGNDASSNQEHYDYLVRDLKIDFEHPLGLGTGASTVRYGQLVGTGESAVLGMFGDLGVVGGAVYLALYLLAIWNGFRAYSRVPGRSIQAALPLTAFVGGLALIPITATSDVWGDLSVTFLFWWAAGSSATLVARLGPPAVLPHDTASGTARTTVA
jgi:hypothetical protein